jgi:hypothetical protein
VAVQIDHEEKVCDRTTVATGRETRSERRSYPQSAGDVRRMAAPCARATVATRNMG